MEFLKKCIKKVCTNSWVKAIWFFILTAIITYLILSHFSSLFSTTFSFGRKHLLKFLPIIAPIIVIFPTLINMFFFVKIIQIADNSNKIRELMQAQLDSTKQLEQSTKKISLIIDNNMLDRRK